MRPVGEETEVGIIVSEEMALDNPFFPVVSRVIRTPDGTEREPQLVWARGDKRFVVVVAQDAEGNTLLVHEPKFGQMRRFYSAPTITIKKGETDTAAALRALLSETGYECAESDLTLVADGIIDFADKTDGGQHVVFLAKNIQPAGQPKGPGQKGVRVAPLELKRLCLTGEVVAMTMGALLLSRY